MTTPETPTEKRSASSRAKRKPPARSGPIRSGAQMAKGSVPDQAGHTLNTKHAAHSEPAAYAAHSGPAAHSSPSPQASASVDPNFRPESNGAEGVINDAVAEAVRNAYQVLGDTVAQGRIAADQFQHGDYNMRDVPVDVRILGQRMIKLARDLSETTFIVIEQLLRQMTRIPDAPKLGAAPSVPPFPTGSGMSAREHSDRPPSSHAGPGPQQSAGPADETIELDVVFTGNTKAHALASRLARPAKPTGPEELSVTPLQRIDGKGKAIEKVRFSVDIGGKLFATVTVPTRQAPGRYSGIVMVESEAAPLGTLTIEVRK
ncbi:hypothetical protein ACXYL9_12965 [Qipengyuania sp. CAU 1752]